MRLAERHGAPVEAHFTEGELDLEPPEELAIGELDDETILEEELDNEDVLEQDVDEDLLEASLEDLVHGNDDVQDDGRLAEPDDALPPSIGLLSLADDATDDAEDDFGDEDLEESLDLVLLDRLALLHDGEGDDDDDAVAAHDVLLQVQTDAIDLVDVAPCRSDEFVCRSCFLVRKRVQLVDPSTMACHDCAS
jgi:hypothetical protein